MGCMAVAAGLLFEARGQDLATDREALEAVYNATDGANWSNNQNWLSDVPLEEWYGVTVHNGRVISLFLDNNRLTGPIPAELGGLANLQNLSLAENQLTGSIPVELGGLANLQLLSLHTNQLTGPIPAELGGLANLQNLWLNTNQLTGPIPAQLGGLANLQYLSLHNNQLTGSIPVELGSLANLQNLSLYNNQLTGSIPVELGGLANLQLLSLHTNQLTGPIPAQLGGLANLQNLLLHNNRLTGAIPAELGGLANLQNLSLFNNELAGSIPVELGGLANLQLLSFDNNELTGPIPAQLGSLANLQSLLLQNNRLTGSIPAELGGLASLHLLSLDNNELTGAIPAQLGGLANLQYLSLAENQLTGSIPAELGGLANLQNLWLNTNQLTGPIPAQLGGLANLQNLSLAENQLTGSIPVELGSLASLQNLSLAENQLTGSIPVELGGLANLQFLSLHANQLTGAIPAELGGLASLHLLSLDNNELTGPIPAQLGGLANLQFLSLAENQLTGSIPAELGGLANLQNLWLNTNQLTGPIPAQLGGLANLQALNLHNNQLTGSIPAELGSLANLQNLSLSENQLTGSIPVELGGLANLQVLSLNTNQLTGAIPTSFTNLMSLELFWFHENPGLCDQPDASIRAWLSGIGDVQVARCPFIFVPVLLTSAGRNDSFFTSELTLTNRGTEEATLHYTYTADAGGGNGTATDTLAAGRQRILPNAIDYLTGLGIPIPDSGNRIGTLRVEDSGSSEVSLTTRTTTKVPDGRAGLAYPSIAREEGFQEAVYLCGLRQNTQDRSNVAFQHMGSSEDGPITLRTTIYSGEADDTSPLVVGEVELQPGGFHQYSGLLGRLTAPAQGYVKVEKVSGEAPFYAYGVINDNFNSDGSFVFPVTESSLVGTTGQTLPVIIETGNFQSELTVTNFSATDRQVDFSFVADGIDRGDDTATFSLELKAGEQQILPDIVEELRGRETAGIGPANRAYVGALFARPAEGDLSGIVIGARTGAPDGRGGQYSLFYNGVPYGGASVESAWIYGLQQNAENRSNLALVNTGEIDDSTSTFEITIYDGSGESEPRTRSVTLGPRRWTQENGILGRIGQGYVQVRKTSGNNPFITYGVINDGGRPGERSGDGAFLPAQE